MSISLESILDSKIMANMVLNFCVYRINKYFCFYRYNLILGLSCGFGNTAHIGGLQSGMVIDLLLKFTKKYWKKMPEENLFMHPGRVRDKSLKSSGSNGIPLIKVKK